MHRMFNEIKPAMITCFLLLVSTKFAVSENRTVMTQYRKVTIRYDQFAQKLSHEDLARRFALALYTVKSMKECGQHCLRNNLCDGFFIPDDITVRPTDNCKLVSGNMDTRHFNLFTSGFKIWFYERKNVCSKNPNLCEHGSSCWPHYNNNSFTCKWCYYPYYGKYCNETLLDSSINSAVAIPSEIKSGIFASCANLASKLPGENYRIIYPYKDLRAFNVSCYGSWTYVTRASATNEEELIPVYDDLVSIKTDSFFFTIKALQKYYFLVKFKIIIFVCQRQGQVKRTLTLKKYGSVKEQLFFKYLINETQSLPECVPEFLPTGFYCKDVKNGKFSDPSMINSKFRIHHKIIQFNDGTMLSVQKDTFACFDLPTPLGSGDFFFMRVE